MSCTVDQRILILRYIKHHIPSSQKDLLKMTSTNRRMSMKKMALLLRKFTVIWISEIGVATFAFILWIWAFCREGTVKQLIIHRSLFFYSLIAEENNRSSSFRIYNVVLILTITENKICYAFCYSLIKKIYDRNIWKHIFKTIR